jgi:protein-S-isoprenylcysteine O-methyltransferase Ste14
LIKVISKFAFLILIVVIVYLWISGNLVSSSPFAITGQLIAIVITIWARQSFRNGQFSINAQPVKRPLLLIGPYQYIRHPMYASALLFVWSSIWGHVSLINVIIGLIFTGVMVIRIIVEEQFLRERYPNYSEYSFKTKRIIPFII